MFAEKNIKSASCATSLCGTSKYSLYVLALILVLFAAPVSGQSIHQLNYDNEVWADSNVTELSAGVSASTMTAFYTTPNDELHVFYSASSNNHIHQMYQQTEPILIWFDQDLTGLTDGEAAMTYSGMSGFSIGNAQYLYFCGADEAIHEYSYGNNGHWSWSDAALPTGGSDGLCGRVTGSALGEWVIAFAAGSSGQRYVYYAVPGVDSKGDGVTLIDQLYFNGSTWSNENLTQAIQGTEGENNTAASGFAIGSAPYIFFTGTDKHVHEFSDVSGWTDQDLTVAAKSAGVTVDGVPAAFVVPGTTQIEVYYFAAKNADIHQMTFASNKWKDTDLSSATGGSFIAQFQDIIAFPTTPNNNLHVYSEGENECEDQLYYNGSSWSYQVLPSVCGSGDSGALAGFAIGNLQYVYYIVSN